MIFLDTVKVCPKFAQFPIKNWNICFLWQIISGSKKYEDALQDVTFMFKINPWRFVNKITGHIKQIAIKTHLNLHLIPISFLVHNDLQNFKKETCAVQKLRSLFEYIGNFKIKFWILKHVFVKYPTVHFRFCKNRQSLLFAFVVQFLLWVFYVILWT